MPNFQVSLTPALDNYVESLIETGMYDNRDEIIREALRLKIQQDQVYQSQIQKLRQEVAIGAEQIENGQVHEWNLEETQRKLDLEEV